MHSELAFGADEAIPLRGNNCEIICRSGRGTDFYPALLYSGRRWPCDESRTAAQAEAAA